MRAPASRIRALNAQEASPKGAYVLYWMVAARRPFYNFALSHAVSHAREFGVPLLILEALRVDYPWASARLHGFIVDGMADHARHFEAAGAFYYPYLERRAGEGRGLLQALAQEACVVVTDDYPAFFLPHMLRAAGAQLKTRLEAVDGNGLVPLSEANGRAFVTAYSFRRFLQQKLPAELVRAPQKDPLTRVTLPRLEKLPRGVEKRWPRMTSAELTKRASLIAGLPIDQTVRPVPGTEGGYVAAREALETFLARGLDHYLERNHPDKQGSSGLSPFLHFGHVGVHQVVAALKKSEAWDGLPGGSVRNGAREGFWGLRAPVESFLDELVTWRELSFNTCVAVTNHDEYASLPAWARSTLEAHAKDPRSPCYTLAQLEAAETYDEVWNAAQRQLVQEGRMQSYMRMLWGKKILEWSPTPERALAWMIELNNKYALDGRDPNSYSGIFWILGRYDRPWAPERQVYGTIRYMSSDAAKRKLRLKAYLARYGKQGSTEATDPE